MKRIKYLLFFLLPFVFAAGCINGQAVFSLNKDGSGKVSVEGLFDYPLYCEQTGDYAAADIFFIEQIKTMVSSGGFEAWSDVNWKFLDDGRCYFKGTVYFSDVNEVDFFVGSAATGIKLEFARRLDKKPTIELKLRDDFHLDSQIKKLPAAIFKPFNMNFIVSAPAEIEGCETFQRIDNQTVTFVFSGGQWLSDLRNNTIKAALTSDGNDLFDYKTEVGRAKKDYAEILKRVETAYQKASAAKDSGSDSAKDLLNTRFNQALVAEGQGNFKKAITLYNYVLKNSDANEKSTAGAEYQIGVCLFRMKQLRQAAAQFESVIKKYPQSPIALKSEKMLAGIRDELSRRKTEEKTKVFVADTIPKLYAEDVDSNTASIKITFSQPMKPAEQFYSSFAPADFPAAAGKPAFDSTGIEWTLPVKLEAGKVYALAVNCGDAAKNIKNFQTGFQSVSGQMCEKFVLVFATSQTDPNAEPVAIDTNFIERCEKTK